VASHLDGASLSKTIEATLRRAFDWPLLLFLLSATLGLWIAYDRAAAWAKFWLILGGLALYVVCMYIPEQICGSRRDSISPLRMMLSLLPTGVAICFLLTNDWARWIGKLSWLDPAMSWFSSWQLSGGSALNPNVAGGVIAAFLPLQVVALSHVGRGCVWISVFLVGVSAVGLLMSATRGAWLALGIVTGTWELWRLSGRLTRRQSVNRQAGMQAIIWGVALLMVGLVCALTLTLTQLGVKLVAWIEGDRWDIWGNSLALASDYAFTGLGLGNFEMAYASYVLLTHVGYIFHAHNLFLDLWLEQGLLGLLAFGWLVGRAVGSNRIVSPWRPAALAALGVVLLHGLMDDALYGYGGWGILLLFVPVAILNRPGVVATTHSSTFRPMHMFWSGAVFLSLAVVCIPSLQAVLQANLGALMQTRTELASYEWPDWPIQDALRRSSEVQLDSAIQHYQAALALDPANVTANRRLGQIELSRGQYELAWQHLEMAYAAAPSQRATRQLLGECYAVAGDVERATALWRTVDVSQGQLMARQWWYEHLGEQEQALWVARAAMAVSR
jgi:tetratricopeptide (TPR) repeat protein